jgi:predicted nucleotidyltransferase component of viral defense system
MVLDDYGITEWVEQAEESQREFRQGVHTILAAIANDPQLKASMVIKGGILLAVRYHSHRYTRDIDFSTSKKLDEIDTDQIKEALNTGFIKTAEALGYELDCRVQSCRVQPASQPDASFPSIKITVGYAYKGSNKHKRLLVNQSPTSISIDYNLNELMPNLETLDIGQGDQLRAYTLTDLIAEKLRSLLQQKIRNRTRRQDIFDLRLLIEKYPDLDNVEKQGILKSFIEKSESRDITPNQNSLDDTETRKRSQEDYLTLTDEIEGDLPDFDETYDAVNKFYKSLPWA